MDIKTRKFELTEIIIECECYSELMKKVGELYSDGYKPQDCYLGNKLDGRQLWCAELTKRVEIN